MKKQKTKIETACLHAGQEPDPATLARAVPVYRTSSYLFRSTRHAADLFALRQPGNIYSRLMNPTQDVLERRVAALEGGAAALALASGTSAVFYTVVNICRAGDEVAAARNLYGGTYTQFNDILPQLGIRVRFFEPSDPRSCARAITKKTKLVYCETIGNPGLEVADLEVLAETAHSRGLPLVVDNTFATPVLARPLERGADIVVHSLTKWLGGHGAGIGGIVVDSGKFDWTSGKFPLLSEPDSSYHGLVYTRDLGALNPLAFIVRMRLVPLRNLGACISPDNAWIFLQGIETLPLRMARHCENALAVARYLQAHPRAAWVRYPGLEDDPSHALARKYLAGGAGGVVVFGIRGGAAAGARFIDRLRLFSHLANVGDAKSLAIHPASTTHAQLSPAERARSGLGPDLIRLSVGIEHIDDLIEDLDRALKPVRPRAGRR
ncbi:MAG TPA: O-acetylhomoserine aminocarboxypropyltransferase/cysteine synthase [bacterium]|nr:O-acetylhomoserine aminocarboxypropyltransferase/cysteine synthase [bacterium]HPQ65286.1 O-acetylhomoserine aminocarboxypropyltransferase/cysteine synthase [bacterium]